MTHMRTTGVRGFPAFISLISLEVTVGEHILIGLGATVRDVGFRVRHGLALTL
jgi:hypothetical protein